MTPFLLTDIEKAVRSSWSAETCTPAHRPRWSTDNPARDQCGVTAMVVNDLLGGELIRGEVHVAGERVDYHWWNRLGTGVEIDLTREQFGPEETVVGGVVVPRPPITEWRRLRAEYELLRDRVMEQLGRKPRPAKTALGQEQRRGAGQDLCLRLHAATRVECVLPDTHYPLPHRALDGASWHDGLCLVCRGEGESGGDTCATCDGGGFSLVDDV